MANNSDDEDQSQDQTRSKRAPNFSPEEDEQLAKSWAVISQDPIRSNQQGKDEFFARIADNYNKYTPGPKRDAQKLGTRWKLIQRPILRFGAIYDQIAQNPASGSAPSDWLRKAKQTFLETEGRAFAWESAWELLKTIPKWQTMGKGKAKKTVRPSASGSNPNPVLSPNPATQVRSGNSTSEAESPVPEWKRPEGIKKEKRKVEESEFRRRKLKLLEKATNDAERRIVAANRLNEIQERLAVTEERNSEMRVMMQKLDECPDDDAREYVLAHRKIILDKIRNPPPPRKESQRAIQDEAATTTEQGGSRNQLEVRDCSDYREQLQGLTHSRMDGLSDDQDERDEHEVSNENDDLPDDLVIQRQTGTRLTRREAINPALL
ncbi:uncharacterized protein PGTG_22531 [Puccinia graminis f. sp. tritici CRL 75-36-700-3]|uniref:No apical meristem-associated C-terminal domain-containing protein n=1 Tax=Puccinia graminis f. sp. tritici (strain CRL 75-36-700-3 / race SCCL) TaxID=418459 RepID=H6QUT0_PUCGT|nr:uncharacterized protein PGTG_22531 [Puccinia graminis f. sp. tritici CRL 75-36-700-3]EHS64838.1 hypothetical protein PGTG_22531 [Puccinia graminis f. sp. tritici CRL 75-36-700-3]